LKGVISRDGTKAPAIWRIAPDLFVSDSQTVRLKWGGGAAAPLNNRFYEFLLAEVGQNFSSVQEFSDAFNRVEFLIALVARYESGKLDPTVWYPSGRYIGNYRKYVNEFLSDFAAQGDASPYVAARLFGDNISECRAIVEGMPAYFQGGGRFR
jgi:hypothetical protein